MRVVPHKRTNSRIKLPAKLSALEDGILSVEYAHFIDPKSGKLYEWLYYGKEYNNQPMSEFIVIASPMLYKDQSFSPQHQDGKRVAAYLDGHVIGMDEAEFQAAIKKQLATTKVSP